MTRDINDLKRQIDGWEQMRAEFGPLAPASISGFIDHEVRRLKAAEQGRSLQDRRVDGR